MRYKEAPKECKPFVVENGQYNTMLTTKYVSREKYAPHDPKKISAVIPGTVREIFVREGKRVKKGDNLLILEAMKMMNNIVSPMDGIIKSIHVTNGTVVPKAHLLLEFE
ncbi:MAG: acetyl-CoA carboxylase biotin carboxyl carrier protein subunit [Bacteroidetes bacterium]|nr:MAG: acetyl-CoA carboxylase biotin carboxyl carrier protein subunit [Bacteroidota bacterium]PIE88163.1 MAG: acetyl-CoA carboxylase biotin carboxyl carrier protein subunit [Bacteroidota bacterium]